MSWVEAKMINSSILTREFKPIDELIKESTRLLASYDYALLSLNYLSASGTSDIASFSNGGTAYFSADFVLKPSSAISEAFGIVTVEKQKSDGTWETIVQERVSYSGSTTAVTRTAYALANIEANANYRMRLSTSSATVNASSLRIRAIPVSAFLEITRS